MIVVQGENATDWPALGESHIRLGHVPGCIREWVLGDLSKNP